MLIVILQAILKCILSLGTIFGLVFMILCTVFVITSAIYGDIRISIVKDEAANEKK